MRSKTRLKSIAICAAIMLFYSGYAMAGTWITLDCPSVEYYSGTSADGISDNKVVGQSCCWGSLDSVQGFLYDGMSWTNLRMPGSFSTWATAISGDNIVGGYNTSVYSGWRDTRGFLYNIKLKTWTTLDYPGGSVTSVTGISGSNIVGTYLDNSGSTHGFLYNYNGESWATLDYLPGCPSGISGNSIVGSYTDESGSNHGFLYNGESRATLDYPGARATSISGIDGGNIVGTYEDTLGVSHNFLYHGTHWSTLDDLPGSPSSISGNNIVGYYSTYSGSSGYGHGFIYTIDLCNAQLPPQLVRTAISSRPEL